MTPGSIVHYQDFTFEDGGHADKLLVVLNKGGAVPYLVLRTTSQQKASRVAQEGCHAAKGYYFLPAKRESFPKDTWILLYQPYELVAAEFLQAKFKGLARIVGQLREETLRAIINCFRKPEDCAEHHQVLLGKK